MILVSQYKQNGYLIHSAESKEQTMLTLKNENLTVGLDPFGAELTSVKDAAGREYIWQGNPAVWSGHAPVLFPIAGRLLSDSYVYGGEKYYLACSWRCCQYERDFYHAF